MIISPNERTVRESKLFYGWIVVGLNVVIMALNNTVVNTFGVFFKPMAADLDLARASTSAIQSLFLVGLGVFGVGAGWLADRFGNARMLCLCGLLTGIGLLLTSRARSLEQVFLCYSLVAAIGISGLQPIAMSTTARWFVKRRGLAFGITATGASLGLLIGVPVTASLIAAFGWSRGYMILGVILILFIPAAAFLLRRKPEDMGLLPYGLEKHSFPKSAGTVNTKEAVSLSAAVKTRTLWLLVAVFFMFGFCNQMIVVHLVNYATDMGLQVVIAATLMSAMGLSSAAGRLLMGAASDRIGNLNTLVIAALLMVSSLVWLTFCNELWMLYVFSVTYGFAYGAETPQLAALPSKFFGLRTSLVGMAILGSAVGAALGSWVGGRVFDVTQSYHSAFLIGSAAASLALMGTLLLKRRRAGVEIPVLTH